MKHKGFRVVLCILLMALLVGCDGALFDPEYAITAPKEGVYQGVNDAVIQAVGEEIILKYPSVQGFHAAYYPWDMNQDGTNEVLVFYQLSSKKGVTRVHVLQQQEGKWVSQQDLEPVGSDVAHVDFCDLNGDGVQELCLGWTVATDGANRMGVYQIDKGRLVQRALEAYTQYVVCDIDGDRIQDLGLALLSSQDSSSTLRFYTLKSSSLQVMDSIFLDGNVISYEKIVAKLLPNGQTGVYLDVNKSTESTITELVYYKEGKLYNPFAGGDQQVNIATLRYCHLYSTDINQDGKIEVPFMEPLPGYTVGENDREITHHFIDWRVYNGSESQSVVSWFYNTAQGYYLALEQGWKGKVTVVADSVEEAFTFYTWNDTAPGAALFSIKVFSKKDLGGDKPKGYLTLTENDTTLWGVQIRNSPVELPIDFATLQRNFHLIIQ